MEVVRIFVIGAGLRGMYGYAPYIHENPNLCKVIGVAEIKKGRRDLFKQKYQLDDNYVFESVDDFLSLEKIADAVIIASSDDRHYEHAKKCLEKGYHVLLEKPVANSLDGLVHLNELCDKYDKQIFMTCHVLRYTKFFEKLREIVNGKGLGELISIQHNENIGYWHYAHSYTRGNWRNSSDTAALILTKSCHDIDILSYISGSKCKKIASFGNQKYMNNANFDDNMSENCLSCKNEKDCPYSAKKIYIENSRDINHAVHINPTEENLLDILKDGPYGKCVYNCDNNVVDNMVSILEFENKVTATFNLCAYTKECDRTIKLMFSKGEVGGSLLKNEIRVKKFGENEEIIINPGINIKGHGGGDLRLIEDFIKLIKEGRVEDSRTSVKYAIESHIVAFAAEYSRVSESVVYINEFYKEAIEMTEKIEDTLF
ncbi:gfo/Idh/MocA family oxidoreductase [Romboutsia weinsteinii]|uniref:Gfo/Idh/MocA family oxidoreductase n=1 Tax=Romboutsia weinsteinii TaxID=2020949 RepID=A0A371J9R7_9FIRM|nr:Gfo/Idh/MocA family oxidoreductase [Romboutsia weinsteinii]RDY29495.1 gfo/Idh/MocA family oxidoreductase [Romboutsia weinsteinii]